MMRPFTSVGEGIGVGVGEGVAVAVAVGLPVPPVVGVVQAPSISARPNVRIQRRISTRDSTVADESQATPRSSAVTDALGRRGRLVKKTPSKITAMPARIGMGMDSCRRVAPQKTAVTGRRNVTVDARVAPSLFLMK